MPGWSWDPLEDNWKESFEYLKEYVKENGHARPKGTDKTSDGYPLGSKVSNIRGLKKKGKLEDKYIKKFEAMPGWSWDLLEDNWNESFEYLKEYVAEHGVAIVNVNLQTKNGFKLGGWVSTQRTSMQKGTLSVDHIIKLESLPSWFRVIKKKAKLNN